MTARQVVLHRGRSPAVKMQMQMRGDFSISQFRLQLLFPSDLLYDNHPANVTTRLLSRLQQEQQSP